MRCGDRWAFAVAQKDGATAPLAFAYAYAAERKRSAGQRVVRLLRCDLKWLY